MAGKKRKVNEEDIIAKPMLLYKINSLNKLRDRALVCFIYMSGCRISEVVGCKKIVKQYQKENGKFLVDEKRKRVYDYLLNKTIPVIPLTKESIEIMEDKQLMLIHEVPCLKRLKELPKRYIPVFIPIVKEFYDIFMEYYKTLQAGDRLFNITRQRAWQIIHNKLGLPNSHFLIHERVTHLVVQEGFSDQDLKQFRGWSSTLPANSYVHMRWQDLARKQGAKLEE